MFLEYFEHLTQLALSYNQVPSGAKSACSYDRANLEKYVKRGAAKESRGLILLQTATLWGHSNIHQGEFEEQKQQGEQHE